MRERAAHNQLSPMFSLDLDSKVLDPKNNQPFLSLLFIQSKGGSAVKKLD